MPQHHYAIALLKPLRGSTLTPTAEKKSPLRTTFLVVAGTGFEPRDLQVMSLTSYQTAPPRDQE